ncbi:MAG: hypothetical protein EOP38_07175 [Rubrivivax sp.]|nr:MAG: hypothetical protein EOP38_07175 [Rubrivivax sp.]
MSYILDALRRADSERERGTVPSIHAPPPPPVGDEVKPPRQAPQALLWVIVALSLALAGSLAWQLMSADSPKAVAEPASSVAPMSAPAQVPVAQAPAVPDTPAPPPVSAAPAPTPLPATPPEPPAPMPRQETPQGSTTPARAPTYTTSAPTPSARQPAQPSPAAKPPAPNADSRVYAIQELPEDVRRDLPKLVIGGAMYSDTPASRMLIINSQVFHEGDTLMPGLLLQEIRLKSAVLKYKGYRYALSY